MIKWMNLVLFWKNSPKNDNTIIICVIPNMYDFISSLKHKDVFKIVQATLSMKRGLKWDEDEQIITAYLFLCELSL